MWLLCCFTFFLVLLFFGFLSLGGLAFKELPSLSPCSSFLCYSASSSEAARGPLVSGEGRSSGEHRQLGSHSDAGGGGGNGGREVEDGRLASATTHRFSMPLRQAQESRLSRWMDFLETRSIRHALLGEARRHERKRQAGVFLSLIFGVCFFICLPAAMSLDGLAACGAYPQTSRTLCRRHSLRWRVCSRFCPALHLVVFACVHSGYFFLFFLWCVGSCTCLCVCSSRA